MAALVWSAEFSVGNDLLDSDHRILLNLINQLYDAVDTGQSRDVVGSVINVLAEYVEHHFRREEAMLASAGFPDIDTHKLLHRRLEDKVRAIRDRWLAGERQALGDEVLDFLRKWLTDHIMVSDKAYCAWLSAGDTEGGGKSSP